MQILPFVAIMLALFLDWLMQKYRLFGSFFSVVFLLYLIIYFFILMIRPVQTEGYKLAFSLPVLGYVNTIDITDNLVEKYNTHAWPIDTLLQDISTASHGKN